MTIYSQRDPQWSKIQLGTGPTTIGQEGCFITCLAMICGKTPDVVNTILRDNGGYVNGNQVSWYPASKLLGLTPIIILAAYSNDLVLRYLKDGKNVLVIVDGAPIGGAIHMVRYTGNQRCIDPWDGTEKPTSAYPNPRSIVVYEPLEDTKPVPADLTWPEKDQYEQIIKKINEKLPDEKNYYLDDPSRLVDTVLELREGQESLRNEIRDKEQAHSLMVKDLQNSLNKIQKELDKERNNVLEAQKDLSNTKDALSTLQGQLLTCEDKLEKMEGDTEKDSKIADLELKVKRIEEERDRYRSLSLFALIDWVKSLQKKQ